MAKGSSLLLLLVLGCSIVRAHSQKVGLQLMTYPERVREPESVHIQCVYTNVITASSHPTTTSTSWPSIQNSSNPVCRTVWTRTHEGSLVEVAVQSDANTVVSSVMAAGPEGLVTAVSVLTIQRTDVGLSGIYHCRRQCPTRRSSASGSIRLDVLPSRTTTEDHSELKPTSFFASTSPDTIDHPKTVKMFPPASEDSPPTPPAPSLKQSSERDYDYNTGKEDTVDDTNNNTIQKGTTQLSLYLGLVGFSILIVVLCCIAWLMTSGSNCPARCKRLFHLREDPSDTRSSAVVGAEPGLGDVMSVSDAPPSYEEVMVNIVENPRVIRHQTSVFVPSSPSNSRGARSLNQQLEHGRSFERQNPTSFRSTDNGTTSDANSGTITVSVRETTTSVCDVMITSSTAENTTRISSPTGAAAAFVASAVRRFAAITPPNYFQVIKDWASKGIQVNLSQLSSPPPLYSELSERPKLGDLDDVTTILDTSCADNQQST